jgi:hypothetical protein
MKVRELGPTRNWKVAIEHPKPLGDLSNFGLDAEDNGAGSQAESRINKSLPQLA